ncbi:hypothetical protein FQN60_004155, partial [Etheostoma spectabile]
QFTPTEDPAKFQFRVYARRSHADEVASEGNQPVRPLTVPSQYPPSPTLNTRGGGRAGKGSISGKGNITCTKTQTPIKNEHTQKDDNRRLRWPAVCPAALAGTGLDGREQKMSASATHPCLRLCLLLSSLSPILPREGERVLAPLGLLELRRVPVHAAVTVGPEEGMRVGYRQCPGALPPLRGVLWRLHKGNWKVKGEKDVQGSVSRGILGGRICSVEKEVLQMLRVTMLTGLREDEQIVERWKEKIGPQG